MAPRRVAVTGGNGTVGGAILRELAAQGYETVNLSRGDREEEIADGYQSVDLLDAGAVYGALAATAVDAVVHMGTIPSPRHHPGYQTYRSNVQTAYNVLEAATALDCSRVVLPSSINAMGASFQEAPIEVEYLPVDEDHPLAPRDPYGVAKHAMEVTADGVARRPDAPSIVSLRYPWVTTPDVLREYFVERDLELSEMGGKQAYGTRQVLFTYLHVEDAATIARAALEADVEGHERFWAVAGDTTVDVPTEVLLEEFFSDAEVREPLSGTDPLVSTAKAEAQLGWTPERTWREEQ